MSIARTGFHRLRSVRLDDASPDPCVTFGRALGGRAVYAVGYTGLGVGASRFGARTALDLLDRLGLGFDC
jgi:hypothetical protein